MKNYGMSGIVIWGIDACKGTDNIETINNSLKNEKRKKVVKRNGSVNKNN